SDVAAEVSRILLGANDDVRTVRGSDGRLPNVDEVLGVRRCIESAVSHVLDNPDNLKAASGQRDGAAEWILLTKMPVRERLIDEQDGGRPRHVGFFESSSADDARSHRA